MPISKCPRCNRVFNRLKSTICYQCEPDEEADYEKVHEAMRDLPEATAEELSESAQVDREVVFRMLEQGFISNVTGERVLCGRCGAPAISASKKLCQQCLSHLDQQVAMTKRALADSITKSKAAPTVRQAIDSKRR